MTKPKSNRMKKQGGGRYAALAVLALVVIALGGYLLVGKRSPSPGQPTLTTTSPLKTAQPLPPSPESSKKAEQPVSPQQKPDYPVEPPPVRPETGGVPARSSGSGLLAIIIDDMGGSLQEARSLQSIGVPLTFSIIPGLRNYREVAAFAASSGIEVMIHIPMQSKGWPQRRLEENGLLVQMEDAAIRGRIEEFMQAIPQARGANNHMGSEFTEHEDKMRPVLSALKGKGLYFIDSVTSSHTVGQRMAQAMGMKTGRRHVFLDNEQNSDYINGQLEQAVRQAQKTGSAIAICHPHPATIRTLAASLPGLKGRGITLVSASKLVK